MVGLLPSPDLNDSEYKIESGVKRPDHLLKGYRVFIQDTGSGTRYLPMGSTILVQDEVCMTCMQPINRIYSRHA